MNASSLRQGNKLVYPPTLRMLPLWTMGLLRCAALRSVGLGVRGHTAVGVRWSRINPMLLPDPSSPLLPAGVAARTSLLMSAWRLSTGSWRRLWRCCASCCTPPCTRCTTLRPGPGACRMRGAISRQGGTGGRAPEWRLVMHRWACHSGARFGPCITVLANCVVFYLPSIAVPAVLHLMRLLTLPPPSTVLSCLCPPPHRCRCSVRPGST